MIYISHRTMFLTPWTFFFRYLSCEPHLFSKGQQSCASAILRNWVSLRFSMLGSHRICFLEGLSDSEILYLPSCQITVINLIKLILLTFIVDRRYLWCGAANLPCTQKSVKWIFTTSRPHQGRDRNACFGHFPKCKNSSNKNIEGICLACVWGWSWGWAICT